MKSILFLLISLFTFGACQAQSSNFYGVALSGGTSNDGAIFKTTNQGDSLEIVYNFQSYIGKAPVYEDLCQASNGKFYGTTEFGGLDDKGVLFEYDPVSKVYIVRHSFGFLPGDGIKPESGVIQAANGKIYGVTTEGGYHNDGCIYAYEPITNYYGVVFNFDEYSSGLKPIGGLIQASNGKLYGTTYYGQTVSQNKGMGNIFEFSIVDSSFVEKYSFSYNIINGHHPLGELLEVNGVLYGTTKLGGHGQGVLYKYTISTNNLTLVHKFIGPDTGLHPMAGLVLATNGKLYGTTKEGGVNNLGVLYEYNDSNNTVTKLVDFDGSNKGKFPTGKLVEAYGSLYGHTTQGGSQNKGVLFAYNIIQDTFSIKKIFQGYDGQCPFGTPILATNGKLYGVTAGGGEGTQGVLYEYNIFTSVYYKHFDFNIDNGSNPHGELCYASNGNLYGVTQTGASVGVGTIYEFDPISITYTKKATFDRTTTGAYPKGGLVQAPNGCFYGSTKEGGAYSTGTIFKYNPINDILSVMVDLKQTTTTGMDPVVAMTMAPNGKIYGSLSKGGSGPYGGSLFEIDPSNDSFTLLVSFASYQGNKPNGKLLYASDGKLYVVTKEGGNGNSGVLYSYDLVNDTLIKHVDFSQVFIGRNPIGNLVEISNGKICGVVQSNGSNGAAIFEYDFINNVTSLKKNLLSADISYVYSGLMKASNGKIYGLAKGDYNGSYPNSRIYEYDLVNDTVTIVSGLNDTMAHLDYYNMIIEANIHSTQQVITTTACDEYLAPSGNKYTQSGFYRDTVSSGIGNSTIYLIHLTVHHVDTSVTRIQDKLIANLSSGYYQWLDCNTMQKINGATSQSFTPPHTGSYAVIVYDGVVCIDTSSCHTILYQELGNDILPPVVEIYPNPFSDVLKIEFGSNSKAMRIVLRNVTGQKVKEMEVNTAFVSLQLNELTPALYFIELQYDDGTIVTRKVIKHMNVSGIK